MINARTFEYADSRWQDIFLHLENAGFDVYSPATKAGECTSQYIVVKNDGSTRHAGISTDDDLYAVMCYVPKDSYSTLEPMVQAVKRAMKELEPMILPYGSQTPSYYDDSYKAHMVSIQYKNYKKLL
ncbi:MAG: hypothetical protein IKK92_02025 [Prevotella sp.]|nr:hypothetical protein [Prevotella sp.]